MAVYKYLQTLTVSAGSASGNTAKEIHGVCRYLYI